MSGANKISTKRPNREEIVDLFRACAAKNGGKAPGGPCLQPVMPGLDPGSRRNEVPAAASGFAETARGIHDLKRRSN